MDRKCQRCESPRILELNSKCDDRCTVFIGENESDGYVPRDLGIGDGDYVRFALCLQCGQMQGEFPKLLSELEEKEEEDD